MNRSLPGAGQIEAIRGACHARDVNESVRCISVIHLDRDSARARSARSSVDIGQCSSQLMQCASISAPDFSNSTSSSRGYPVSTRS